MATIKEKLVGIHKELSNYADFVSRRKNNWRCEEAENARAVQEDIEYLIKELKYQNSNEQL